MAGPSAEDRVVMRRAIAEARNAQPPGIMFALGPAPAERLLDALEAAEKRAERPVCDCHTWPTFEEMHAYVVAVEGQRDEAQAEAARLRPALREVMEDHAWRDELWHFTDETEAVLAALEPNA